MRRTVTGSCSGAVPVTRRRCCSTRRGVPGSSRTRPALDVLESLAGADLDETMDALAARLDDDDAALLAARLTVDSSF
jgi:hypothetical protein